VNSCDLWPPGVLQVDDDDDVPAVVAPKATASAAKAASPPPAPARGATSPPVAATAATAGATAARPYAAPAPASAAHDTEDDKPTAMEGWLEKKGHGKMMNDWARRYCRIDEATCSFVYYKSSKYVSHSFSFTYS
jgi:hypothetical protein